MPVPSPRNSIRIARGNFADLNANSTAFGEGEFIYAIDQDRFYTASSGVLVAVGAGVVAAEGLDTLADVDTSTIAPGIGQVLKWDGTNWVPADDNNTDAVTSVAGKTGDVTLVKADVGLSNVDNTSDANKPISTATQSALDLKADLVGGVVPNSQLPSLAITEYLGTVANEAALLALSGQRGDWAIRTDTGSTWVITTDGGSTITDWTELATPADAVTSVNGFTGTVVLSAGDVGAATASQGALADTAVQRAGDTMTGALGVPVGSAASPSVYFDADTGLYSPGADQVAISTGGTGRLFVDASGNICIGKTTGAGTATLTFIEGTTINWENAAGTRRVQLYGDASSDFVVETAGTERLRIDSDGRLLVGTSTARTNFFDGAGPAQTQLEGTNYQNAAASIVCNSTDATHPSVLILGKSYSGSIGSNTLVPNGHMIGAIDFQANDGTDFVAAASIQSYVDGVSSANDMPGRLVFSTTADGASYPTERMRIDSSGNVGIGTESPANLLHLSAAGTSYLQIQNTTAGNNFYVGNSTGSGIFELTGSNQFKFISNSSDRVVIDSDGRLLVGTTTTSAAPLTVNGTVEANESLYRAVFGNGYLDGDTGGVSGGNPAEVQIQSATSNRPAILSLGGGQGSGESLGAISFFNSNNTDGKRLRASIVCGQEGATANEQGGLLMFSTTADSASTPTERMRIDSSGNVGIGTESPLAALHIGGSTNGIRFGVSGNTPKADIKYTSSGSEFLDLSVQGTTTGHGNIRFFTGSTPDERARIDSTGRLLVGTSTNIDANSKLQIESDANDKVVLKATSAVANNGSQVNWYVGSTYKAAIYGGNDGSSNSVLTFSTTADGASTPTERMRIDSSGNVGIGTGNPRDKLEIKGANGGFSFRVNAETSPIKLLSSDNTGGANGQFVFAVDNGTTEQERMRIDSSGNVGIGTADIPSNTNLAVLGNYQSGFYRNLTSGNRGYTINLGAKTSTGFADGGSISGAVESGDSTGYLYFGTRTSGSITEKARIDSSGKLLVGTSTSRTTGWTTESGGEIFQELTNYGGITIFTNTNNAEGTTLTLGKSGGTTAGSNTLVSNNDRLASFIFQGADGTDTETAAAIHCYVDGTPGADDMPGRIVLSTTASGASNPTERMRITSDAYVRLASGTGGIQFNGDTAAASALDDYEEGTWNVTLNANLSADAAYSKGYYVKIGSLVWINYSFKVATVSGSDNVVFSGLPFANSSNTTDTSRDTFVNATWANASVGDRGLTGYLNASATSVAMFKLNNNADTTNLQNSDLSVNDFLWISGFYRI